MGSIELPSKPRYLTAHLANISFGITELQKNPDCVIGYRIVRALGNMEREHEVIPTAKAQLRQKEDSTYRFTTLDELLEKQKKARDGRYKVEDGLIVAMRR